MLHSDDYNIPNIVLDLRSNNGIALLFPLAFGKVSLFRFLVI